MSSVLSQGHQHDLTQYFRFRLSPLPKPKTPRCDKTGRNQSSSLGAWPLFEMFGVHCGPRQILGIQRPGADDCATL